jgi:hypothetical protein
MPATPTIYSEFGQALGFAERTLTAVLREHLALHDTKPETWYALRLIGTQGPGVARADVVRGLSSPNFNADAVSQLLARLEADGVIRGDTELELTSEGEDLHRSLREYILGPAVELLSQFPIEDIEITVHVLKSVTTRAANRSSAST